MLELVKFELKKLFTKKMNIIVLIVCLFLITILFGLSGIDFLASDELGNNYKGQEAINLRKEQIAQIKGTLTNDRITQEINDLQDLRKNPDNLVVNSYGEEDFSKKIYNEYLDNRLNLLANINKVYAGYSSSYIDEILKVDLENTEDFYTLRQNVIKDSLNQEYSGKTYTDQEKEYWVEKSSNVETPFEYDFYYGWSNTFNSYQMTVVTIIAVCICLSSIFSGEYQSGADNIILTSKYGKSKAITAKIIASIIFATIVFVVYLLFSVGSVLLMFGTDGWNLPIQIMNILSVYPLTFFEAFLFNVGISYAILLGIVGLTLFLSSKLKGSIAVFIIDIAIIMIPSFFRITSPFGIWNKTLLLMPYNSIYTDFSKMVSYHFGNIVIDQPLMTIIAYLVIMIITLGIARRTFKKHQVA